MKLTPFWRPRFVNQDFKLPPSNNDKSKSRKPTYDKNLTTSELRKDNLRAKMKQEEIEKQIEHSLKLKQQEVILKEQKHRTQNEQREQ